MSKLTSLQRHLEIIKYAKKGAFTGKDLQSHLENKTEESDQDLTISMRTLPRDLAEIDTLFGISIQYDKNARNYRINQEDSWEENMELLESFEIIQAFGPGNSLRGKVFFERRLAKGTEYLKPILTAIETEKPIEITYCKYWSWEVETRTLKPLALKEYQHRWYVFVWDETNQLKNFAVDRIRSLHILLESQPFPATPNLEARFAETIGVINEAHESVETVILTFTAFQGLYIQSMPWHSSQTILANNDEVLTISLQVKINYELISEILSHGDRVRVDQPERLKKMVRDKAENMVNSSLKK